MIKTKLSVLLIAIILVQLSIAGQVNQCSDSSATLYDGYLDSFIYYGYFNKNQNSFLKFVNPFIGNNSQNEASVQLWAKFPNQNSQKGSIIDCSATLAAKINDNNSITLSSISRENVVHNLSVSQLDSSQMLNWNHFSFSFKTPNLLIFINGVQKGQVNTNLKFLITNQTHDIWCVIGNNQKFQDPINAHIRHLVFYKSGMISNQDYSNQIHNQILPQNQAVLSYFKFDKNFNGMETYYYNTSRKYSYNQLTIMQSSESEKVCYCTSSYPHFLNISSSYVLNSISLNSSQYTIDQNGFTISFYVYALANSQQAIQSNITILSLQNFLNIVFFNNEDAYKLELITPNGQSIIFNNYRIRYSFWTLYKFVISNTTATLFIDSQQIQQLQHTVVFPAKLDQFSIIRPPAGFSYLLYQLSLLNSKQNVVYNQAFTYDKVYPTIQTSSQTQSGIVQFTSNNELCLNQNSQQPQNYWSGQSCTDSRTFAYFNEKQNGTMENSMLKGNIKSSQPTQTIEFWFKDTSTVFTNNSKQVLFENSADQTSSLLSISLTVFDVQKQLKTIRCSPYADQLLDQGVQISNMLTSNSWIHLACVSDQQSNSLKIVGYQTLNGQTSSSIVGNSVFNKQAGNIVTAIGSSFNGTEKFTGFIRDFRLWSIVRTEEEIQVFRFNMISDNQYLIYYFKLNEGYDLLTIRDSFKSTSNMIEQSYTQATISWTIDKDLIICQQSYYFNGQCCSQIDLSKANFKITYSPSTNFIVVSTDPSTINSRLYDSIKANYTLIGVGNDFNYSYKGETMLYSTYLKGIFQQNGTAQFNVSSIGIQSKAYSLLLQGKIYSDYYPSITISKNQTLTLVCPIIQLNILPNYVSDSAQIVSYVVQEPDFKIYSNLQRYCYDPKNGYQDTYIKSITWSHNMTKYSFSDLFQISEDQSYITAMSKNKHLIPASNPYLAVTAKIIYNSFSTATTIIYLQYQPLQIVSGLVSASLQQNVIQGQILSLDLSGAYSTSPAQYQLQFSLDCPFSLFKNSTQYNQHCAFKSNGQFKLDTSNLGITANYPYIFKFYMILKGTSIIESYTLNITFYKDGGKTNCPKANIIQDYYFNKNDTDSLEISPDTYLYCSGTYYNIFNQNWQLIEAQTGKKYTHLLSYPLSIKYQRSALLVPTNFTSVPAGTVLNISTNIYTTKDGYSFLDGSQLFVATAKIYIEQSPIIPIAKAHYKNRTQITSNTVNFMDELLILNATESFDPDNSTSKFQFSWFCPPIVLAYYNCSVFFQGQQSQYLEINALQKTRIGFQQGEPYTFILQAKLIDNPYKQEQNTTITIKFLNPSISDTVSNTDMGPQCGESIDIPLINGMVYKHNNSYPKVVRYDKLNYTSAWFYIRSQGWQSCNKGSVVEQLLSMYIFSYNDNNNDFSLNKISWQKQNNFQTDQTVNNSLALYKNLANQPIGAFIQVNIYQMTYRGQSSQEIFANIQTLYLIRYATMLFANVTNFNIIIDKYSTLRIDASNSYDPENLYQQYTYIWSCPNKSAQCTQQTGSILNLSYQARVNSSINEMYQSYNYSVIMSDGQRNSKPVNATVMIYMKNDYSDCVKTSFNIAILNSYYEQMNRTIYIMYGQQTNVNAQVIISSKCENINFNTGQWLSNSDYNETDSFYKSDTNHTGQITLLANRYNTLVPMQPYQLLFQQQFSMGFDTNVTLISQSFFNVIVSVPELVLNMYFVGSATNQIGIITSQNISHNVFLDASSSIDPIGKQFTCQWDCPSYFGGVSCSNNYGSRQNTQQVYFYLADSSQYPYDQHNISTCGIHLYNSTQQYLNFSTFTVFVFNCQNDMALTDKILSSNQLHWSIYGLSNSSDYYVLANKLYLKPYKLNKIISNELVVNLNLGDIQNTNTSIRRSFKTKKNILTYDDMLLYPDSSEKQLAYTSVFNISFVNFISKDFTGLNFQLRALVTMYNSFLIIIPMKQFRADNIQDFYSSITIPWVTELYIDFFDMNFNYVGSYEIYSKKLLTYSLGILQYYQFDQMLEPIISRVFQKQPTAIDQVQFENDMKSLIEATEMLKLNRVYGVSISMLNDYSYKILVYLSVNFESLLELYHKNGTIYEREARFTNNIRTIYILNNLLLKTTNLDLTIASIINILSIVSNDYNDMVTQGSDLMNIRTTIISLVQILQQQLPSLTIRQANKTELATQLNYIQSQILGSELQAIQEGQINEYAIAGSSSTRMYYKLLSMKASQSQQASKLISSNQNSQNNVQISNQTYMQSIGVSVIEVMFYQNGNESCPTDSKIEINAYDKASKILNLNQSNGNSTTRRLSSDENVTQQNLSSPFFNLQLRVKPSFLEKFRNPIIDPFDSQQQLYFQPICVYFDESSQKWSQNGIQVVSFNQDIGIINCQVYHLSLFTVDYIMVSKKEMPVIIQPIGETSNQMIIIHSYFDGNNTAYGIIIGLASFLALVFIVSTSFYNKLWNYEIPQIVKSKPTVTFSKTFTEAFFLFHPLFSAKASKISHPNIFLNMTKINKVLSLLITFYLIAFVLELVLLFLENGTWSKTNYIALAVIIIAILLPLRLFFSSLMYCIHFYGPQKQTKIEFDDISKVNQLVVNKSRDNQQVSFSRDSPLKNLGVSKDQFELQMEGGESEKDQEESLEDESSRRVIQNIMSPNRQVNSQHLGQQITQEFSIKRQLSSPSMTDSARDNDDMDSNEREPVSKPFQSSFVMNQTQKQSVINKRQLEAIQQNRLMQTGANKQKYSSSSQNSTSAMHNLMKFQSQNQDKTKQQHNQQHQDSYMEEEKSLELMNEDSFSAEKGVIQPKPIVLPSPQSKKDPSVADFSSKPFDITTNHFKSITSQKQLNLPLQQVSYQTESKVGGEVSKRTMFTIDDESARQALTIKQPNQKQMQKPTSQKDEEFQSPKTKHKKTVSRDYLQTKDLKEFKYYKSWGTKLGLIILMEAVLIILMILTFNFMRKLKTKSQFETWIGLLFGIFGVLILVIDTIMIFIFAILFQKFHPKSNQVIISSALLIGNSHQTIIDSLLYEINR